MEILKTQKTVQAGTTVEKVYQLVIAVPQVWLGTKEIVHANGLIKFYPVKNKKKLEPLCSHVLMQKIGTVATDELLCLKNAGTQISMFFTSNE